MHRRAISPAAAINYALNASVRGAVFNSFNSAASSSEASQPSAVSALYSGLLRAHSAPAFNLDLSPRWHRIYASATQ
jgi:hypothetical protein